MGPAATWAVVIPIKPLPRAKTRLGGGENRRAALTVAMALDTVEAAARCPSVGLVSVVCDDPTVAAALGGLTACAPLVVIPDRPRAGLSAAMRHGAQHAQRRGWRRVAALVADLPALVPAELARALEAPALGAAGRRGVVADQAGTGTVLLCGSHVGLQPRFGEDSFRAHRGDGAVDLTPLAGRGLRCDVDTDRDLACAMTIGVGPATRRALAQADEEGGADPAPGHCSPSRVTLRP